MEYITFENLLIYVFPVLIAITFHEAAHAISAYYFGDMTAKLLGRVSLNPFKHIDPFGTVLLPLTLFLLKVPFLFGYAKPVPVNFRALRKPRFHSFFVAAAGPMTNFLLAIASALLIHLTPLLPEHFIEIGQKMCLFSIFINVLLGVFNLFPIPPLDGGRMLVSVLPLRYALALTRLEPYGLFILLGSMFLLPFILKSFGIDFNPVYWLLMNSREVLTDLILKMTFLQ